MKWRPTLDLTLAALLMRDNMLERGTLSILCTFQTSRLTLRPLLPKLKVSVANKTELCSKNASETACMHSLVMAQLS